MIDAKRSGDAMKPVHDPMAVSTVASLCQFSSSAAF